MEEGRRKFSYIHEPSYYLPVSLSYNQCFVCLGKKRGKLKSSILSVSISKQYIKYIYVKSGFPGKMKQHFGRHGRGHGQAPLSATAGGYSGSSEKASSACFLCMPSQDSEGEATSMRAGWGLKISVTSVSKPQEAGHGEHEA